MADGRHSESLKIAILLQSCTTDFDEIWHDDAYWPWQRINSYNFEFLKIQDNGGRHLEKSQKNRDISATV